ncbi:hypothetical protein GCM10017714_11980 [Curtobacterium pusillum]|uniref:Uncharacterized protein n=1 Tax=Curtobacterium pusillum TaxID=69373 RepID=A0ABX2MAP7_9MICO|nr:hypothetical protein [Curtobacterium pusillum]NUU13868.1 hypothetical protein [Curtobacterium pusillum]GLK30458.1 hypothetical protein GCM10017610_07430 [Curtobacterium pusillum]
MPESVIATSDGRLPEAVLSGYAFVGPDVVFGEDGRRARGDEVSGGHDGAYTSVTRTATSASIGTDANGAARLYLYRAGARWAVGSSLIELAEWAHASGHPLDRDDDQLASFLLEGTIGSQLVSDRTVFRQIRLVPVGATVAINAGRRKQFRVEPPAATPAWESYGGLLRQALWEIASRTRTLLESDVPLVADVTGGRDFRIVLAALRAGNGSDAPFGDRVRFRADRRRPEAVAATEAMSEAFGLQLNQTGRVRRAEVDPRWGFDQWRRDELGVYGPIYPYRTSTPELLLSGTGGEAHRRVYKSPSMESVLMQSVPDGMAQTTVTSLVAAMDASTAEAIGEVPDARMWHFRAFRERFHGGRTALRQPVFAPLTSSTLRRASRLRDPSGELGTQITVDVIRNLAPELLEVPLEPGAKPFPARQVLGATTVSPKRVVSGTVYGTSPMPPAAEKAGSVLEPFREAFDAVVPRVLEAGVLPREVVDRARTVVDGAARVDRFAHASDGQVVGTVLLAGEVLRLT